MEQSFGHVPVLMQEVLRALRLAGASERVGDAGDWTYVDCTAGLGGHAAAVAVAAMHKHTQASRPGTIILNDLDAGNLQRAQQRVLAAVAEAGGSGGGGGTSQRVRVLTHRGNFAALANWTQQAVSRGDCAPVTMLLADLGFASSQVDDPARGLSFSKDGPLNMRLDPAGPVTAATLIATLNEDQLTQTIRDFGEERHARLVAQRIIEARHRAPITTTGQLASIIRSALASKTSRADPIDPATRTFQALRLAVNDELGNLAGLLDDLAHAVELASMRDSARWLAPHARLAIISFHSLEDRPVKQCFDKLIRAGHAAPVGVDGTPSRKAEVITATDAETDTNPRARSAKMRVIEVAGK
ncbi:MAG: 16S rRNA (cytosine(1402)-N(4))-methyltransferase RsmH [Phycisphaerales bacterium]|jgi:16S rRNA (cytosine1402-N4)-methyltransferase|nr:16S rRNA (cytosine(1402)-N(4))-methyltransferase RsmH [Phycisphaerales bacterium]